MMRSFVSSMHHHEKHLAIGKLPSAFPFIFKRKEQIIITMIFEQNSGPKNSLKW